MTILVTGAAGFIGMHVSQILLGRGDTVVGIDNLNDYYDPQLKRDRLARLTPKQGFSFQKLDVADREAMHNPVMLSLLAAVLVWFAGDMIKLF